MRFGFAAVGMRKPKGRKEVSDTQDISTYLGRQGTIQEHLEAFFDALLEDNTVMLQFQASYRHVLRDGMPEVELPIFLQVPVQVGKEERKDRIQKWSEAMDAWRKEKLGDKEWSKQESLHFKLTVLSELTKEPSPMLVLKDLKLPGTELS